MFSFLVLGDCTPLKSYAYLRSYHSTKASAKNSCNANTIVKPQKALKKNLS